MTALPPPRPADVPPLGPPIRRPDDHLPRPESYVGPTPPAPAPPKRRLALLVLALGGLGIVIVAGSYALASRSSDDGFDTEAAAAVVDEVIGEASDDRTSCPLDDLDGLLARAFDDVGSDTVFDTIDLGTEVAVTSGEERPVSLSCQLYLATPGNAVVGVTLSGEPGRFLDTIEASAPAGGELERTDGPRSGTIVRASAEGDGATPAGALAAWVNDDLAISIYALGAPSEETSLDDLQSGLEDVLVDVVDDLAGDATGD